MSSSSTCFPSWRRKSDRQLQLLSAVMSLGSLRPALSARRASTGRPARDRAALATAFFAKSILNRSTTRQLMDRLRCDAALRRLCGWNHVKALPHESKFSRAFALFATSQLPQNLDAMLADLPRQCDIGAKKNSKGHEHYWRGYKLHLDVADGQIPIPALLTSASVHDSQVAIPLMKQLQRFEPTNTIPIYPGRLPNVIRNHPPAAKHRQTPIKHLIRVESR